MPQTTAPSKRPMGLGVRPEPGSATYYSIVYGRDNTKLFTFPYQAWANEGFEALQALTNWSRKGALERMRLQYEYQQIIEGFEEKLQSFRKKLQESTLAVEAEPEFEDDGLPLVTFSIPWVGNQQKLSAGKEVAPGLATLPGTVHNVKVWPIIHVATGRFLLRAPSYEMARKAAQYITGFMDFRPREAASQFPGSNLTGILQDALIYGRPFPRSPLGEHDYRPAYVSEDDFRLKEIMSEVDDLIGMSAVKAMVHRLVHRLRGQYAVYSQNENSSLLFPLHFTLAGPTGSGKTRVASLLARVLHRFEYLTSDKLVVAHGEEFLGLHSAMVADRVRSQIDRARGGLLMIDDAQSLFTSDRTKNYAGTAINMILQAMESPGLVTVCLAGTIGEIENVLKLNPQLSTFITHKFSFTDYTPDELTDMAVHQLQSKGFGVEEAAPVLAKVIRASSQYGRHPANGRFVDSLVGKMVDHTLVRIGQTAMSQDPSADESSLPSRLTLTKADVLEATGFAESGSPVTGNPLAKTSASEKLASLVGLQAVKADFRQLMSFVEVQQKRHESGVLSSRPMLHAAFFGPPGTGKTTVARVMAEYLYGIGLLESSRVMEVTRADLVAEYLGQTAIKTQNVIRRAMGSVLFIDEAYTLASDAYGSESIGQLIQAMEEHRDELCVILAGYEHEMHRLLDSNPGFKSRISIHLRFPHYTESELLEMAFGALHSAGLRLTPESEDTLVTVVHNALLAGGGFVEGNGRWIRTLVEKVRLAQSHRIVTTGFDDLASILPEDLQQGALAIASAEARRKFIGFSF